MRPSPCVHHALGNALAVLMGQLFEQLIILQQDGAAVAGGQAVLVVGNGGSSGRRQAFGHVFSPCGRRGGWLTEARIAQPDW